MKSLTFICNVDRQCLYLQDLFSNRVEWVEENETYSTIGYCINCTTCYYVLLQYGFTGNLQVITVRVVHVHTWVTTLLIEGTTYYVLQYVLHTYMYVVPHTTTTYTIERLCVVHTLIHTVRYMCGT